MSQLLGRQDCIRSLRKDLEDIQGAILDVFSRTGPLQFSSWKYPDKLSCKLDMESLLEEYDYVDGEEAFNQHSHIVLLELVIDRLLLLLQSVGAYTKQEGGCCRDQAQQKGCLSVGLVVRNYWSSLIQFSNRKEMTKYIAKQTQPKTINCDDTKTESPVSQLTSPETVFHRSAVSGMSSTSSFKFLPHNNGHSSHTNNTLNYHEADCRSASCQTIESSLVPCDACQQVQSHLINTGRNLVHLLQNEGLPSSLQRLSAVIEDSVEVGHMIASDVAQWADMQLKDIRRLEKHLQDVRNTVQPLKDELVAAEKERKRLRSHFEKAQKKFNQEVEKHQTTVVQLEFSLQKARQSVKDTEQKLQEELQQLKRETFALEESNTNLKAKVVMHQETLQALEYEKNVLNEKVKNLQKEEEACSKLQQRIHQLKAEISDTQLLLDKETAKYHSACRQQESMQMKQKSLLGRVDALDEECEELQRQLEEREETEAGLNNQLQQMSEVNQHLQSQLTQQQDLYTELQKEKHTLETHADELKKHVAELKEHVQALTEREKLLVSFPELSSWPQDQPQSTGDMLLDMEQQLKANSIRIKILEQENSTLHKTLEKLRQTA
ncbi:coiled-coil domain-containing protein 157, partial [Cololabis saira]|uniref:coiled-coil domain-containing protein 157 n=1 Tax=Cololabis saira TaxID=129043 RepID=UPI002AD3803D